MFSSESSLLFQSPIFWIKLLPLDPLFVSYYGALIFKNGGYWYFPVFILVLFFLTLHTLKRFSYIIPFQNSCHKLFSPLEANVLYLVLIKRKERKTFHFCSTCLGAIKVVCFPTSSFSQMKLLKNHGLWVMALCQTLKGPNRRLFWAKRNGTYFSQLCFSGLIPSFPQCCCQFLNNISSVEPPCLLTLQSWHDPPAKVQILFHWSVFPCLLVSLPPFLSLRSGGFCFIL